MWIRVQDGRITATIEERPKTYEQFSGNLVTWEYAEDKWLSTFLEAEDRDKVEDLLPSEAFERWNGPEDSDEELKPGLYRVEAEGEMVEQVNEGDGVWKTIMRHPNPEWGREMHQYRQVIRIKN